MKLQKQAIVTIDLGFGDSGKGSIVDYLVRETNAHTVVRFNGGPQAAHNVVTEDGRCHTFSQFGSGTFVPRTKTHLSRFVLIDPISMMSEEAHLQELGVTDAFARTTIDERALVITPFQRAANRLNEIVRGAGRHGSCGMGIGETMADALAFGDEVVRVRDLRNPVRLREKLWRLQRVKRNQLADVWLLLPEGEAVDRELDVLCEGEAIDNCIRWYQDFMARANVVDASRAQKLMDAPGTIIFEAAQGVLLDEWHGFHPYTTWSTTTSENAEQLLKEHHYRGDVTKVGVMRAYATRHGPGPFVTEEMELTRRIPDSDNVRNEWQGSFRVGWPDLVATRYALAVTRGVDCLAVTNLDRWDDLLSWQVCDAYQIKGSQALDNPCLFDRNGEDRSVIREIKVHRPADLYHQARLTETLNRCHPRYRAIDRDRASYLRLLERELGVPVGIVSSGPTASDKVMQPSIPVARGQTVKV